jgi:hypothetical protein
VRRGSTLVCLTLAACAPARETAAQEPSFPSHEVRVDVTVAGNGLASVREEFILTAALPGATLEFLDDRCAALRSVSAQFDRWSVDVETDRETRPPWTLLHVRSRLAAGDRAGALGLSYDVPLVGSDSLIPIVLPAAALARADDSRGAHVAISVAFDNPAGARVLIPRLEPSADNTRWQGRLLAMPSFVRIRVPSAPTQSCERSTIGPTGGLEWRFAVFVLAMAIWVPAYLSWFRPGAGR